MPNYCKLIIIGHVGQEPEMRYMPNGDPVCNFSIAVTEKRGQSENTTWFRCAAFGKTAEVAAKYVHKGDATMVEGRIASKKFTDKNGDERESWEVMVDRLQLLGGKKPEAQSREPESKPKEAAKTGGFDDLDSDTILF